MSVRPFIKWAGGKGRLLPELQKSYPPGLGERITRYAEPFVGAGAVLFDLLGRHRLEKVYVGDTNAELINTYQTLRDQCGALVDRLRALEEDYRAASDQKAYYYARRGDFNRKKAAGIPGAGLELAALFIFLNKTCYNGLYRVNRQGAFNVPAGRYQNPCICDEQNLRAAAAALQNVAVVCGGYQGCEAFVDEKTLVYFDPPYRPLTATARFTSYTEQGFSDEEQAALARFAKALSKRGASVMISNSDPRSQSAHDGFFDELYAGFHIRRIEAARMINSKADARGKISELLVTNY